jgi:general secretion pathway protein D
VAINPPALQPGNNVVAAPGSATAQLSNPSVTPLQNMPLNAPAGNQSGIVTPYQTSTNQAFPSSGAGSAIQAVHTANATVTADVNTNSIIVIGPPSVQAMYAELVKKLDERRPQVQIECTIVTIDTSDSFQLAVDISQLGAAGANQLLTFSSFGVSTVDITTGQLTPKVNPGGTFALLSPDIADVVINALATNSHARLISAPQLLVNDNGKGQLQSVRQEPFAEILDTNTTQSRTGLGGQAEAGTTISVEPHISKGDYLQLDYTVELSSFTGNATNGLPPPSQKNAVNSTVTIPDGFTIVVGGLSLKNARDNINKIPLLGDIPIIKYLFRAQANSSSDTTLFVFIRPVILRDEKFEDLKYYSDRKMQRMGVPGDYPDSQPIPLH